MPLNIYDTSNPFVRQKAHDRGGLPERTSEHTLSAGTADTQTPNLTEDGDDTYTGVIKQGKKKCM